MGTEGTFGISWDETYEHWQKFDNILAVMNPSKFCMGDIYMVCGDTPYHDAAFFR